MKKVISTEKAPAAIGPYSQAIEVNGMVYTSGIIPVVPETGEIPEGSVAQAKQALTNLSNLLEAAGTNMDNVVKTTVFIKEFLYSRFPIQKLCGSCTSSEGCYA